MAVRILICLFSVVCLFDAAFSYCHKYPPTNCHDGSYTAPPIVQIVRFGPSKVAKATLDNADKAVEFATNIGLGIIGEFKGGSLVGGVITAFTGLFGGSNDLEKLADLYNQLVDEIRNVKLYLDKRIEEASSRWLKDELGDGHTGLMGLAMKVKGKTGTELMFELSSLNSFLINSFNHFVPATDSVVSYEKTLPLFRQFGDLYVSTIVSEIAVFKQFGRHADAAKKINELKFATKKFQEHWTRACGKILVDRTHLENMKCVTSYQQMAHRGISWCDTNNMEGQQCQVKTDCAPNWDNHHQPISIGDAEARMKQCRATYVKNRRRNLLAYWKNQVGNIVQKWNTVAAKFATVQEAYVTSLSEEEQNVFTAEDYMHQSILEGKAYPVLKTDSSRLSDQLFNSENEQRAIAVKESLQRAQDERFTPGDRIPDFSDGAVRTYEWGDSPAILESQSNRKELVDDLESMETY